MSPTDAKETDRVSAFGRILRRARHCAGLSQQRLADLSGVSQTTISRLERGKAPRTPIDRVLVLQAVLGGCLPMGVCPHDHHCIWKSRSKFELESLHRPAAVSGLSFQWPHDDRGDWADDYPELPVDPPVPAQSAKQTEIAPPTGLVEGEAQPVDDQAKLPDWMFEVIGPRRP